MPHGSGQFAACALSVMRYDAFLPVLAGLKSFVACSFQLHKTGHDHLGAAHGPAFCCWPKLWHLPARMQAANSSSERVKLKRSEADAARLLVLSLRQVAQLPAVAPYLLLLVCVPGCDAFYGNSRQLISNVHHGLK